MTLFSKMRLPTFGQGTYLSSVLAVGCFSLALLLAPGARGAEGEGWRNLLPFGKKPSSPSPSRSYYYGSCFQKRYFGVSIHWLLSKFPANRWEYH